MTDDDIIKLLTDYKKFELLITLYDHHFTYRMCGYFLAFTSKNFKLFLDPFLFQYSL